MNKFRCWTQGAFVVLVGLSVSILAGRAQAVDLFANVDGIALQVLGSSKPAPTLTRDTNGSATAGVYILRFTKNISRCVPVVSNASCPSISNGAVALDQPDVTWGVGTPGSDGHTILIGSYSGTRGYVDTCFDVVLACP